MRNRLLATLLIANFVTGAMLLPSFSTEIGGGSAGWVNPSGNTYNISPEASNGTTGFRHYEKFDLSQGDVANLIYSHNGNNIDAFVNMVDNKVNINGILNTVRNNNYFGGKAIFISPDGMAVGSHGVINVGSLFVVAPNVNNYNKYKEDAQGAISHFGSDLTSVAVNPASNVTIDGKISADTVHIAAGSVIVGKDAGIYSSYNRDAILDGADMTNADVVNEKMNLLFNALVNTNIKEANTYSVNSGYIHLNSKNSDNQDTSMELNGHVKNFGNSNITLASSNGILISNTANVEANNAILIDNSSSSSGIEIDGSVKSHGANVEVIAGDALILDNSVTDKPNIEAETSVLLNSYDGDGVIARGNGHTHIVAGDSINIENWGYDSKVGGSGENPLNPDITQTLNVKTPVITARSGSDINIASIDSDIATDYVSSTRGSVSIAALSSNGGNTKPGIYSASSSKVFAANGVNLVSAGNIGTSEQPFVINAAKTVNALSKNGDVNLNVLNRGPEMTVLAKNGNINLHHSKSGELTINNVATNKNVNIISEAQILTVNNIGAAEEDTIFGKIDVAPRNVYIQANGMSASTNPDGAVIVENARINPIYTSDGITIAADATCINGSEYKNSTIVGEDMSNPIESKRTYTLNVHGILPSDIEKAGRDKNSRTYTETTQNPVTHWVTPVMPDFPSFDFDDFDDEDYDSDFNAPEDKIGDAGKNTYVRQAAPAESNKNEETPTYIKFDNKGLSNIKIAGNNEIDSLIGISKTGIAVKHNGTLHDGDVIPVKLVCEDFVVETNIKIVNVSLDKADGIFLDLDASSVNKLLYETIKI